MHMPETHISVLLREAADALLPERGALVDGTFGRGGHTRELLGRMPASARLIAIDRDAAAAESARRYRLTIYVRRGALRRYAVGARQHWRHAVDGILLDIGVSSPQLDDATRGFSFMRDGPLDMRMDQSSGPTAADWIATASHNELTEVIRDYGEERFASRDCSRDCCAARAVTNRANPSACADCRKSRLNAVDWAASGHEDLPGYSDSRQSRTRGTPNGAERCFALCSRPVVVSRSSASTRSKIAW